jgi:hypothetical protein
MDISPENQVGQAREVKSHRMNQIQQQELRSKVVKFEELTTAALREKLASLYPPEVAKPMLEVAVRLPGRYPGLRRPGNWECMGLGGPGGRWPVGRRPTGVAEHQAGLLVLHRYCPARSPGVSALTAIGLTLDESVEIPPTDK